MFSSVTLSLFYHLPFIWHRDKGLTNNTCDGVLLFFLFFWGGGSKLFLLTYVWSTFFMCVGARFFIRVRIGEGGQFFSYIELGGVKFLH